MIEGKEGEAASIPGESRSMIRDGGLRGRQGEGVRVGREKLGNCQ